MSLGEFVWSEWFWLPPGFTWKDLKRDVDNPEMFKAQMSDLWMSFVCAVVIYACRKTLETLILRPIGRRWNLDDANFVPKSKTEKKLEAAFLDNRSQLTVDYDSLAKKVDRSERFVRNWFRVRRNRQKANLLTKFVESGWQVVFYTFSFAYGVAILWNKSYFWDTKEIWRNWPEHHVTSDIYWYYMVELGYYWTASATVFQDTKRKDFREMVIHHFVTIALMIFSWSLNYARIGALILVLHDAADPIFNLAKIGGYIGMPAISDPSFLTFLVVWFVTRLVIYPFRIVYSSTFELDTECGTCVALKILQGFLLVLQVLHVIWSYFILKVAVRIVFKGKRQDSRSDSEETAEENEVGDGSD